MNSELRDIPKQVERGVWIATVRELVDNPGKAKFYRLDGRDANKLCNAIRAGLAGEGANRVNGWKIHTQVCRTVGDEGVYAWLERIEAK